MSLVLSGIFALAVLGGLIYLWRIAPAGAGYRAKVLCSAVHVSRREFPAVLAEDVSVDAYWIMRLFRAREYPQWKEVAASLFGLRRAAAVYRPGRGATLVYGSLPDLPPPPAPGPSSPWAKGEPPARLQAAVDRAFAEPRPRRPRRTRAVVIIKDGKLVAERYAAGFNGDMPLCGWSMSKSVLAALAGLVVGKGLLTTDAKELLPQWGRGDPRGEIRLDDLLRMRSGLEFAEIYANPLSDVVQMLFNCPDAAGFAAGKPAKAEPGTMWAYASGTTNIVSMILRRALERAGENYADFPRQALFDPLGMASAVFETDEAGHFVGSSFMYASARDWAKFGQLFLDDGVWRGTRVLPAGWVEYCRRPTPQAKNGQYGAHWWLKIPRDMGGETQAAAKLPADAYHAIGHEGQFVSVVPSRGVVAVRMGLAVYPDAWNHADFLNEVLEALA